MGFKFGDTVFLCSYEVDRLPNASAWSWVCHRYPVGHSPWMPIRIFPNDWRFTHLLARKSYILLYSGKTDSGKVTRRRQVVGAFQQVVWSLVVILRGILRNWFQISCERRTKHMAVSSVASVEKGWTGSQGYLAPSEGRMNWAISYLSPVYYMN